MNSFVSFPAKSAILSSLREHVPVRPGQEDVFREIAERLEERTYDSAALAFILMEILYDREVEGSWKLADLLPDCVVALTADPELGRDAVRAYDEIRQNLS